MAACNAGELTISSISEKSMSSTGSCLLGGGGVARLACRSFVQPLRIAIDLGDSPSGSKVLIAPTEYS